MSVKYVCDHCNGVIEKDCIKIDYAEQNRSLYKHYHIDCFNIKFSCDIRKIKEG